MDIAELPEALAALARDLERRDDDPFTLRCHAAVLLAKRTIEIERRWLEQAVGHPGPPASEHDGYNTAADLSDYRDALIERLDNELRSHRELMEIRRAVLGHITAADQRSTLQVVADAFVAASQRAQQMETTLAAAHSQIRDLKNACLDALGAAQLARAELETARADMLRDAIRTSQIEARLPSAVLLRLASHLLPTFASDEAEMDSPVVDLEAFGIGREDPEAKLLLEYMQLGSDDAGWPHFPVAYVARGLSAYLLAVSKATRRAAMGG